VTSEAPLVETVSYGSRWQHRYEADKGAAIERPELAGTYRSWRLETVRMR
jgi:hypothetical protein